MNEGLASLDLVDLKEVFESRTSDADGAVVLAGSVQCRFEIGHAADIISGREGPHQQSVEIVHAGVVFCCIAGGGVGVSRRSSCKTRKFERGEWLPLLRMSKMFVSAKSASPSFRSRRREREDEARAARALSLVHMGELSATRQALEGVPVARGIHATLRALTDPERRPALPRELLRAEVAHLQPAEPFQLDTDLFRSICENAGKELHQDHLGCIRTTSSWRTSWISSDWSSHSTPEAGRWHQDDRRGRRFEEVGCQDDREASVEEGVSAWPTLCRPSPMLTRKQPSCLSMGLVRMTLSPGTQCCRDFSHNGRRQGLPLYEGLLWVPIHKHVGFNRFGVLNPSSLPKNVGLRESRS